MMDALDALNAIADFLSVLCDFVEILDGIGNLFRSEEERWTPTKN